GRLPEPGGAGCARHFRLRLPAPAPDSLLQDCVQFRRRCESLPPDSIRRSTSLAALARREACGTSLRPTEQTVPRDSAKRRGECLVRPATTAALRNFAPPVWPPRSEWPRLVPARAGKSATREQFRPAWR